MKEPEIFAYFRTFLIFLNFFFVILFFVIKDLKKKNIIGFINWFFLIFLWFGRLITSKHFPFFGAYESSLTILFFTGIILLFFYLKENLPSFYLYTFLSLAFLVHSSFYSKNIWAMTISEKSIIIYIHIILAYLSFILNFIIFSSSILKLNKKEINFSILNNLIVFYFFYTSMLIFGFLYRFFLFGKVISFDPIETIHLSIFLTYTTLIHISYFKKWNEEKIAKYQIFCFILFLISYRIILFFPPEATYHIIDIELRMHIIPK